MREVGLPSAFHFQILCSRAVLIAVILFGCVDALESTSISQLAVHMWDTQSYWFDIALIFGVFAIGNILLGHFEEHRPKWRRLLKVAIVLSFALLLSYFRIRWATYAMLALFAVGAGYIHLVWLPKNGVNGWTGEPKQKYYELLGVKQPPNQSNSPPFRIPSK